MSSEQHPLLGSFYNRKFHIFRTEHPAIFRFNGKLFAEDFNQFEEACFSEVTPEWADAQLRVDFGGLPVAAGANPDTCHHHLVCVIATLRFDMFRVCVSCASTIDDEFFNEFVWDFEFEGNCWKRQRPRSGSDEALAELRRKLTGA